LILALSSLILAFFSIVVLIFSVVIHEVAHGYTALLFGDSTAKNAGRLTLNPIKHIDILGSIIVPLVMAILPGGIILGWAKPVPYNPYNLTNRRWGEFWVAFAGPISNILIATVFVFLIRSQTLLELSSVTVTLMFVIVLVNMVLALFNMLPIPPLDGSKIFLNFLPFEMYQKTINFLQGWGIFLILFFVFFVWDPLFRLLLKFIIFVTGVVNY
jgi:Zn-dependent protease